MTSPWWMLAVVCGLTIATLHLLVSRGWAGALAIDMPNARSLHASPIPRVGGLVMVPVALVSALVIARGIDLLLLLAAVLCVISFVDDRWDLPVVVRLVPHVVVAILVCRNINPPLSPWVLALAIIGVVWAINLYNFLDGADGLAGGMALFGFSAYGWAMLETMPGMGSLSFCLAAAAAGFLVFNFSPARVFMGDAGSVPLGFLAGSIGLIGWAQGAWPVWFPLLVFSPFVVDGSVTLLRRLMRKERFWLAHRDHYYQRVVRMGWSHRRLALAEYALMAACGTSALALLKAGSDSRALGLSAWAAVYAISMVVVDRRWERFAARGGDRA